MKIPERIYRYYDQTMNGLAYVLFPPPKKIGRIAGHEITLIDLTIVAYTVAIGLGLSFYYWHWFWFVAVVLSMIMAWMMAEWFF